MNAWNEQLGEDLLDAVRTVGADPAVRAVVITRAGEARTQQEMFTISDARRA